MEITTQLDSFTYTVASGTCLIKPRLEPIFYYERNIAFELLCSVFQPSKVCPVAFFSTVTDAEMLGIYRLALAQIPQDLKNSITINVSSELVTKHDLFELLLEFKHLTFILELSENYIKPDAMNILAKMRQHYQSLNFELWLDDFGSNFANFDLISTTNFDGIKFSKELFWSLYLSEKDLLAKLLKYLRKQSKIVVVEGVDTCDRLQFVVEQRCAAQGYFLNKM